MERLHFLTNLLFVVLFDFGVHIDVLNVLLQKFVLLQRVLQLPSQIIIDHFQLTVFALFLFYFAVELHEFRLGTVVSHFDADNRIFLQFDSIVENVVGVRCPFQLFLQIDNSFLQLSFGCVGDSSSAQLLLQSHFLLAQSVEFRRELFDHSFQLADFGFVHFCL